MSAPKSAHPDRLRASALRGGMACSYGALSVTIVRCVRGSGKSGSKGGSRHLFLIRLPDGTQKTVSASNLEPT